MPTKVQVPGIGIVEFPDGMSEEDISQTIEMDILPKKEKPKGLTSKVVDFLSRGMAGSEDFGSISEVGDATTPEGKLAVDPNDIFTGLIPPESLVSPTEKNLMEMAGQVPGTLGKIAQLGSGLRMSAADLASSMTSPAGIATVGMGGMAAPIGKAIGALWGLKMASDVPEAARSLGETTVNGNLEDQTRASMGLLAGIAIPGMMGKAIPSTIKSARASLMPISESVLKTEPLRLPERSESTRAELFSMPEPNRVMTENLLPEFGEATLAKIPTVPKRATMAEIPVIGEAIPAEVQLVLPERFKETIQRQSKYAEEFSQLQNEFKDAALKEDGPRMVAAQDRMLEINRQRNSLIQDPSVPRENVGVGLEGTYPPTAEQLGTFQTKGPIEPTSNRSTSLGETERIGTVTPESLQAEFPPSRPPRLASEEQVSPTAVQEPRTGILEGSQLDLWADKVIKDSQGRSFTGFDPELFGAYVVKGAAYLEYGVREFSRWSAEMVKRYGESIKPHLQEIFDTSQKMVQSKEQGKPFTPPSVQPSSVKDVPLGLNRTEAVDPSLRLLSEEDFDAEFRASKKSVNQAEKDMDDGKVDTRKKRQELGEIQDRWASVSLERYRRNYTGTSPSDILSEMRRISDSPQLLKGRENIGSEDFQKFKILTDELKRQNPSSIESFESITSLPKRVTSNSDFQESLKGQIEDVQRLVKIVQDRSTSVQSSSAKPEIVGMGGARPEEFIPPKQDPTSNKNAIVDQERAGRGLPPMMEAIKRGREEVWDQAMKKIDRDPSYQDRLVEQLKKKPRALNDVDNMALLHRRADIRNEYEKAVRDGIREFEDGNMANAADAEARANTWSDKLSEIEEVSKKAGTESGRSLAARKMMMNEDFSLASMELKKRQVNSFRKLTQEERVDLSKTSKTIESTQSAIDGLESARGKNPMTQEELDIRFENKKAKDKFNEEIQNDKLKNSSFGQKVFQKTSEGLNAIRSLVTSFDLSALLRQGKFIGAAHPVRAAKIIPEMFKALASEKNAFKSEQEIINRPNYPLYEQSGLYLADHGVKLSKMEENYMSRLAEKIPGIGKGVAASQRAYTTFLNRLRADSFDAMSASLAKSNTLSLPEAEAISNFVNVATGRGPLGAAERAATQLNTVFFSPRYVASRFQILAGHPLYKGTGRTRTLIAKEYARFLTGMAVVYTLALNGIEDATLEDDPRSSDFGKIKIGNTRLDPMAGLNQVTTLVSRIGSGDTKTIKGNIVPLRGDKVPFKGKTVFNVGMDFLRTKFSPVIGTGVDIATGKNVVGDPVTPGSVLVNTTVPISFRDVASLMEEQGVAKGTALFILSIFGEGVQTYDTKRPK